MDHGLVDQIRLTVHPFVLGCGDRLLEGVAARTSLSVVSVETIGTNLVHLVYGVS
jgi:riboflavin biosynthesis pyrimidine reductase